MAKTAAILGVGPGLGRAVATCFAHNGCDVALIARSEEFLDEVSVELDAAAGDALPVPMDVTEPDAVVAGFETIRNRMGPIDVVVDCLYSTTAGDGSLREVDVPVINGILEVEVEGVARFIKAALEDLVGGGTIIFTNSPQSKRGSGDTVGRTVSRFGLRGFAESLARDLGPEQVHVAHVVIDGWIDKPSLREAAPDRPDERWMEPAEIADTYWDLVSQDQSAWTFELDLRAYTDSIEL
jgi:NAD(P)-dependent dehydrogenase (short-subunit alcohol dehydrogenase family)